MADIAMQKTNSSKKHKKPNKQRSISKLGPSNSLSQPPKYLTQMKGECKIPTNNEGKAISLTRYLCRCSSIYIQVFHITWITFFICFFSWFSLTNLTVYISKDLNLTLSDKSWAISIRSISTVIFRIVFGDLCDRIGARFSYIFLLIISLISLLLISFFSYNNTSYIIFSFFLGIIGSSFVITQFHVTTFFSSRCVGIANALSAGWGNFGGGVTMIITPLICSVFRHKLSIPSDMAWRYSTLLPCFLLFLMIFVYYFYTIDSPKGNISKENVRICVCNVRKWRIILSDFRVWVLSLSYAICFGVEVTVLTYFIPYFVAQFNTDTKTGGIIIFSFSILNLFARGLGGYLSDLLYLKFGIQGRIYCLFWVLLFESIFLCFFAISAFNFGYAILTMIIFSLYVQIAEGIVFAIVPSLPHQEYIGLCMGIVAAGGNFGSLMYSFLIFKNVPSKINYEYAWIICGGFVFISSFLVLLVKFTKEEIDTDLLNVTNDYWSNLRHHQHRSDKSITNTNTTTTTSTSTNINEFKFDKNINAQINKKSLKFVII